MAHDLKSALLRESDSLSKTTHLGIGAHPDDLEFWFFPAIQACFYNPALSFTGITMTDGAGSARGSSFHHLSNEEFVSLRHQEQLDAASLARYGAQFLLGFSSHDLKNRANPEPTQALITILKACRPSSIFTHQPFDKHPTHLAVFCRVLDALRELGPAHRPHQWIGCEGWRGLDWLPSALKIPLPCDPSDGLSDRLNGVYQSQIHEGKSYPKAVQGRRLANATLDDPHRLDSHPELAFGLNLLPLLEDPEMTLEDFVSSRLNAFAKEVKSALPPT